MEIKYKITAYEALCEELKEKYANAALLFLSI